MYCEHDTLKACDPAEVVRIACPVKEGVDAYHPSSVGKNCNSEPVVGSLINILRLSYEGSKRLNKSVGYLEVIRKLNEVSEPRVRDRSALEFISGVDRPDNHHEG